MSLPKPIVPLPTLKYITRLRDVNTSTPTQRQAATVSNAAEITKVAVLSAPRFSWNIKQRAVAIIVGETVLDLISATLPLAILPYYLVNLGGNAQSQGLSISVFAGAQVVAQLWSGAASDFYGRRPLLVISLAGVAIGHLLTAQARSWQAVVCWRGVVGIFAGANNVGTAYVAEILNDKERPSMLAKMGAVNALGVMIGPPLGSLLNTIFSTAVVFQVGSVVTIIAALIVFFLLPSPQRVKTEMTNADKTVQISEVSDGSSILTIKNTNGLHKSQLKFATTVENCVTKDDATEDVAATGTTSNCGENSLKRNQTYLTNMSRRRSTLAILGDPAEALEIAASVQAAHMEVKELSRKIIRRHALIKPDDLSAATEFAAARVAEEGMILGLTPQAFTTALIVAVAACLEVSAGMTIMCTHPLWMKKYLSVGDSAFAGVTVAATIISIFNQLVLFEKLKTFLGTLPRMAIMGGCFIAISQLIWIPVTERSLLNFILMGTSILLHSLGLTLSTSLPAVIMAELASPTNMGRVITIGTVATTLGRVFFPPLLGFVYDAKEPLAYWLATCTAVIGIGVWALVGDIKKHEVGKQQLSS
mmetsp:Transcript_21144/g.34887  ORF Transcript_21144/g.34887 Transcript_21144/m.34887 type:complete len:590 (+) Transcript_21144:157-1926(+)|eukprot:CAMPEP_0119306122 /NCGR_PEP_ID=MMETSP1333-20130426/6941_1 /TAXON_ID=418940 /ORGANISM="Scyphosphaera apsteinii, Strain RCC1455" /LENGTH=589 /DNA_ID=CAMNT_0007309349 /DNA_START=150 /DNA_END=1919 /DNA_ORIENTATION=+